MSQNEPKPVHKVVRERAEHLGIDTTVIKTGVQPMDLGLSMKPGRVTILASRTGLGKSTFALQIAIKTAARSPVMFYSYEGTDMNLERTISHLHNVPPSVIDEDVQKGKDKELLYKIRGLMLNIQPTEENRSVQDLDGIMKLAEYENNDNDGKLELLVIDYLQLIPSSDEEWECKAHYENIMRQFKLLATRLSCHVLVVSQLNWSESEGGHATPQLQDLDFYGNISSLADAVVFLHHRHVNPGRSEEEHINGLPVQLIVAKNTNGNIGIYHALWHPRTFRFEAEAFEDLDAGF